MLGVCHHMPAGRQVSHVSPGGWCKATEPLQVRATYLPADVAAEHTGPTAQPRGGSGQRIGFHAGWGGHQDHG